MLNNNQKKQNGEISLSIIGIIVLLTVLGLSFGAIRQRQIIKNEAQIIIQGACHPIGKTFYESCTMSHKGIYKDNCIENDVIVNPLKCLVGQDLIDEIFSDDPFFEAICCKPKLLPSQTPTPSRILTLTPTPTISITNTPTITPTTTREPTPTNQPTPTPTNQPTPTPTNQPTPTPTNQPSPTPTETLTPTPTATITPTPISTPSVSPSNTPTPTPTPSGCPQYLSEPENALIIERLSDIVSP